jgi:hypothetical protein
MKQTATDYLYDQFLKAFIEYVEEKIDGAKFSELMIEARVKSQIMEREQIMLAHEFGAINYQGGEDNFKFFQENDHYYNEQYPKL